MVHRNTNVNLGNLVLSLSDTMDLASPLLTQHQMRTAFIVMQMGKARKAICLLPLIIPTQST